MRKYGKYERMPDGTRAKQPPTKSVLLQTYFSSLLCMVLCVAMFFGTTFAWFTIEVTNAGNEIYIGNLDVGLYKGTTDLSAAGNLFDKSIRWEPGYTALETVQIVNEGDLAFDYSLVFTDGQVDGKTDDSLQKAAKWFDIWIYHNDANDIPTPKDYSQITGEGSGWLYVGTLADALQGKPVCKGQMDKEDVAAVGTAHSYTIALHMNGETVGEGEQAELDGLMGQRISLNVKLMASQLCSEEDGFGNSNYDKNDEVATAEELLAAIAAAADGETIALAAGTYDLTNDGLQIDKSVTIEATDANNKPLLQFATANGEAGTDIVNGIEIQASNVTLKNLNLQVAPGETGSGNLVQISPNGTEFYSDILIDGCGFYGSDHCIALYGNNVTVQNCVLDESAANSQGNIIYVWGTSGTLTIRNNTLLGKAQKKHGISFCNQSQASSISGRILIEGNTFSNVYKGIVHEQSMPYTDVTVEIMNNVFDDCLKKYVAIDYGTFTSYKVSGNVFGPVGGTDQVLIDALLKDEVTSVAVDANNNYWASEAPVWSEVIEGSNVTVTAYYADAEKTTLVNAVS